MHMQTFIGVDYPTWWFLVVGALFSGYAILDGFDLGAGAWHLFLKGDRNRRIALNAVGPVWDGNEVWLVIGGGALFAGFPVVYASVFSAMYIPFMLFLVMLIFRAVSIEFRSKEKMHWWRQSWDVAYSVSSIMMALLLGVVLGNILQGMALDAEHHFRGHWLDFINPYALMVGITTLALFMMHGALFLAMKTEGKLFEKVNILLRSAMIFFIVSYVLVTVYTLIYLPHLSDTISENAALFVVPALATLGIANIPRLVSKKKYVQAFLFSALTMSFLLILVAIELFPVMVFSTISPENSITVYNAASSDKSLGIMLLMTVIGIPLVALYTYFVYKTFWGKVKMDETSY